MLVYRLFREILLHSSGIRQKKPADQHRLINLYNFHVGPLYIHVCMYVCIIHHTFVVYVYICIYIHTCRF